jgi:hypothetical protein
LSFKLTASLKLLNITKLKFAESVLNKDLNFLNNILKTPKNRKLITDEIQIFDKIKDWIFDNQSFDF